MDAFLRSYDIGSFRKQGQSEPFGPVTAHCRTNDLNLSREFFQIEIEHKKLG